MVVHLTLIPFLSATGELKTKPTQHSVKTLQESGVQPDILVCRTEYSLSEDMKRKLALFCNVKQEAVIESRDAVTIYEVPLLMQAEKLDEVALQRLGLPTIGEADMTRWKEFVHKLKNPISEVKIGLVGKYIELKDSYKSIVESLIHAGVTNRVKVSIQWIHSEKLSVENVQEYIKDLDGLLVAPGFGKRGFEGKIKAVQYARESGLPFLGICFGMQAAVIEYARNVLNWKDANTSEVDSESSHKVIDLMEEQKKVTDMGGTMRLGACDCVLTDRSIAKKVYKRSTISERHRHRFEFNSAFKEDFEKAGMKATGTNPETGLVEIVEIPSHPWFVGVQYHPEYKSTVANPHPLFEAFVAAAITHKKK